MLVAGDPRIAEGAEQDGIEFIAKHFDGARRQRHTLAEIFVRTPVKFDKLDVAAGGGRNRTQNLHRFRGDFLADPVTGNDRNPRGRASVAQRYLGHSSSPLNAFRVWPSSIGQTTLAHASRHSGLLHAPHIFGCAPNQASSSVRVVSFSMRSMRGSKPMPGPLGTRMVP